MSWQLGTILVGVSGLQQFPCISHSARLLGQGMLLLVHHMLQGHLTAAPLCLPSLLLSRQLPWHLGDPSCALLQTKLVAYLKMAFAWWQQLAVSREGSL